MTATETGLRTLSYAPSPMPADVVARYHAFGYTSGVSIPALMQRNGSEFGHRPALVEGDVEMTWSELVDAASRFGGFLRAQGLGPGDVVLWQLPNWWEAMVVAYGVWAIGAVSSPVVPIYREFELQEILAKVQPTCVVSASRLRDDDRVEMFESAIARSGADPHLRVVVRGPGPGAWHTFDEALSARPHLAPGVDVDAPALIGWTSGTTSGSKGVVHSGRAFLSSALRTARASGMTWADRSYMPAPVAHATGLLSAIATPIVTGSSAVLSAGWDPDRAIDDITRYGVTTSSGSAVFMRELLGALERRGVGELPLSAGYPCGGSPIPTELAEACDDAGMRPARAWGMTECPGVTGTSPRLHPRDVRTATDGLVQPGCEVRIVDASGADVPVGQDGEALVRGPQRALGYIDAGDTAGAFDADGWLRTGDLGRLDAAGAFTMTGRLKEIINRGGEKLSSREIEDAIARHAGVREVAVVAAPHPRLGEQPAAFVMADRGVAPDVLAAHLETLGLAPQKIPRIWHFVDDFPRTASGKVIKSNLTPEPGPDGNGPVS